MLPAQGSVSQTEQNLSACKYSFAASKQGFRRITAPLPPVSALQTRADTQLRVTGAAPQVSAPFPFLSRYSQLFLTRLVEMTQIDETSIPRLQTFHYLGQQSESVGNTHANKPKFLFALECTSDRKLFQYLLFQFASYLLILESASPKPMKATMDQYLGVAWVAARRVRGDRGGRVSPLWAISDSSHGV